MQATQHPLLQFDSWSDIHCRLLWIYGGGMPKRDLVHNFQRWPQAAWLIHKGSVVLDDGVTRETAHGGQWIFPGNRKCKQVFSQDIQFLCIRFALMWRNGTILFPSSKAINLEAADFPELCQSAEKVLAEKRRHFGPLRASMGKLYLDIGSHFCLMQVFYEWIYHYIEAMTRIGRKPIIIEETDPRIDRAIAILKDHPLNQPWKESSLARLCGLSVSQLNRLFVKYHHRTPMSYYQERRYKEACVALQNQGRNIKSIAFELGFSSAANFATWFRKRNGQSPREWRRFQLTSDIDQTI